jgi:MHS family alpha-ketoglutarate permease-like MFS transporter
MRRNLHETEAFEEAKKVAKPSARSGPAEISARACCWWSASPPAAPRRSTPSPPTCRPSSNCRSADRRPDHVRHLRLADLRNLLQPIYGALSDRIGRKPLLIFFGIAGTLATVPILTTLKETKSPSSRSCLICAAWIFVAGYTSINAIVKAELFPTNVRALGVGLPYAITVSLFGGTAPAVALYFKSLGHEDWFYYYLSGMICLSLLIYATMRDTKHASAMHRHE